MTPLLIAVALFAIALLQAILLSGWREALRKAEVDTVEGIVVSPGSVTVVIPARNAENTLTPLLQDLFAQNLSKERISVVVVDDHSEDGTAGIVKSMMRTWPGLGYLLNDGEGKKAAIGTAVLQAKGEFIALTDADARCGPDRIGRMIARMEQDQLDLLLAPVRTVGERSWLGRLQENEQAALIGVAAGEALLGRPMLGNGANMAFRRSAFMAVNGFVGDRYASGDDVFLIQRMKEAKRSIGYLWDDQAVVTVNAETTFSSALQQRLRWSGKMRGIKGASSWLGFAAVLLPWALSTATLRIVPHALDREYGAETLLLLAVAWLLWYAPVIRLVAEVERFLDQRNSTVSTILSYTAFTIYAPLIAAAALFIHPRWKGRRI